MPVEMPWELIKENLSSFAHDSIANLHSTINALDILGGNEPKLLHLRDELRAVSSRLKKVHSEFSGLRKREQAPEKAELQRSLLSYRTKVGKWNKEVPAIAASLEDFLKRKGNTLNPKFKEYLDFEAKSLRKWVLAFPARGLGKKVIVRKSPGNIYHFLKGFSSQTLVDRDGNPVKIVFRGKNLGAVEYDEALLSRSVFNLVTDTLNHTPGRPIFVTLKRKKGQVAINVTNQGPKLKPEEIAKIGRVRFTRAWQDPRRGYGKISTRLLTEAQGGKFKAANSRIGPMLSITLPANRRRLA